MSVPFSEHPKYNGAHPCPKCQGPSHWTALDPAKRTIKIECPVCGEFQTNYGNPAMRWPK